MPRRVAAAVLFAAGVGLLSFAALKLSDDPRRATALGLLALTALSFNALALADRPVGGWFRRWTAVVLVVVLVAQLAIWSALTLRALPELERARDATRRFNLPGDDLRAAQLDQDIRGSRHTARMLLWMAGATLLAGVSVLLTPGGNRKPAGESQPPGR